MFGKLVFLACCALFQCFMLLIVIVIKIAPTTLLGFVSGVIVSMSVLQDIFKFFDMFLKLNDLATSQAFKVSSRCTNSLNIDLLVVCLALPQAATTQK